ncbi:Rubisco LSMT substrate-binding domain-containing protein [Plasmodiophora brassicae]
MGAATKASTSTPSLFRSAAIANIVVVIVAFAVWAYHSSSSGSAPIDKADALMAWLVSNGAIVTNITIVNADRDRDTMCADDIPDGAAPISLPKRLVLGGHTLDADPTISTLRAQVPDLPQAYEMAVFLVTHRNDPAWKAYVDILPTTMTTPLFWDVADLEWLQSGHVRRVVDDADQELRDTFAGISEHLPGMSFAEFKLALAQVTTRAFEGPSEDDDLVLLPMCDMLNHEPQQSVQLQYDLEDEDRYASMVTMRSFAKGSPIHNHYSNHTEWRLLVNYGFTIGAHEHDILECGIDVDEYGWITVAGDLNDPIDITAVINELSGDENEPDTVEIGRAIRDAALLQLGAFPTTIADDDSILDRDALTFNQVNAVRARRSEKICLRRVHDLADAFVINNA